jgi:hypothetical protein
MRHADVSYMSLGLASANVHRLRAERNHKQQHIAQETSLLFRILGGQPGAALVNSRPVFRENLRVFVLMYVLTKSRDEQHKYMYKYPSSSQRNHGKGFPELMAFAT